MKRLTNAAVLFALALLVGLVLGCQSAAESEPEPEPKPAEIAETPEPVRPATDEGAPPPEPPLPLNLDGPTWVLTYLYDVRDLRTPPDGSVWIAFSRVPSPTIVGSGGTNQFQGSFGLSAGDLPPGPLPMEGRLVLPPPAATRRSGPYLDYERHFFSVLGQVQGFSIEGNSIEDGKLVLYGGLGREEIILAEFRAQAPQLLETSPADEE